MAGPRPLARHAHAPVGRRDRRWLLAALGVVVAFMAGEVVAGLLAHSLALLTDAGHMLTDAAALCSRSSPRGSRERPARGAYTYGFARVDALSGQANGITLLLLAAWFTVRGHPPAGRPVSRARRRGRGRRGDRALVNVLRDLAGRAGRPVRPERPRRAGPPGHRHLGVRAPRSPPASSCCPPVGSGPTRWPRCVVAALMAWTGSRSGARGRAGVPRGRAARASTRSARQRSWRPSTGSPQVHDLHVWQLGSRAPAMSAHVLVSPPSTATRWQSRCGCGWPTRHGIGHVTLQTDHAEPQMHDADDCADAHGKVHISPGGTPRTGRTGRSVEGSGHAAADVTDVARSSCSAESREHPMHVGSLQLFVPPDGADALDVRKLFDEAVREGRGRAAVPEAAPPLDHLPRPVGLGDRPDVRPRAPRPPQRPAPARADPRAAGAVLAAALDAARPAPPAVGDAPDRGSRRRPVRASTSRSTTRWSTGSRRCGCWAACSARDPDERDMPPPWAPRERAPKAGRARRARPGSSPLRHCSATTAGLVPALARTVNRALNDAERRDVAVGAEDDAQRADHRRAPVRRPVVADRADPRGRQGERRDRQRRRAGDVLGRAAQLPARAWTRCPMRR